jgi:hypothetical protein
MDNVNSMNKDNNHLLLEEMNFEEIALQRFDLLLRESGVYRSFVSEIYGADFRPSEWQKIPCLPVSFFKQHDLYVGQNPPEVVFTSSGTTGSIASKHPVAQLSWYHKVSKACFERVYGAVEDWTFFCLLPSYLDREGSSLIEMCRYFIKQSGKGGFYLRNHSDLLLALEKAQTNNEKIMLLGVSFALLDLAECLLSKHLFENVVVMETGGMKGQRKEITRMELHDTLTAAFGIPAVASEYGMTELMSQAYAPQNGIFSPPPWLRMITRHPGDPLSVQTNGQTGLLNIFDLTNTSTVPFIAVDDIGIVHDSGDFEIIGRFDRSDIRGCNLMVL